MAVIDNRKKTPLPSGNIGWLRVVNLNVRNGPRFKNWNW
ncbi:unnamed protein product [Acidithrix sp. C25]|nr:unnamed protein product [Acidithrix sp. C25]